MPLKATNEQLLELYQKHRNVHKVGQALGMTGGSVHERLVRLGVTLRYPKFSEADRDVLRVEYADYKRQGKLADLAAKLGRTKPFICRQARALGLTDIGSEKPWAWVWKNMPEAEAAAIFARFKKSSLGVEEFCQKHGYDSLGFWRTLSKRFLDEWEHVVELKQKKQTPYRLGRHVEYTVRDDLRRRGFPVVMRSARSNGPVDIVGIKYGVVVLVQCKRSLICKVSEWNTFYDLAVSVGAVPVLAGRPTGKGLVYLRLLGRKTGRKKRQPMEAYEP